MALEKIPKKQTSKDETTKIPKVQESSNTSKGRLEIFVGTLRISDWFPFSYDRSTNKISYIISNTGY